MVLMMTTMRISACHWHMFARQGYRAVEDGVHTKIGEKGVNLSGGQKVGGPSRAFFTPLKLIFS